ncbi:MAG TPA: phosphoribosylamine--glycine ligase, partial [Chthoniobacterales bacterium]|nr:phosphoribosylamine--glycine ligase [Chthoniobacterales bacterium]
LVSQGRCVPVKILVVGSGGREHALVWKLRQSSGVDRIFCAPGNAGTEQLGENVAIKAGDLPALARFAKENQIELTVVGPDDPLAAGIADHFETEGLRIFGPTKSAARLESSKIFAKELMRAKQIPTARAAIFEKQEAAFAFLEESHFPIVIKADGLALGKGVIVARDVEEAKTAVTAMMSEGRFGEAGRRLLIEECLAGTECSLHALVDGENFRMLASARDHKRAFDGDAGPNTGGMGAFSPANNFDAEMQSRFEGEVMRPLLDGLRENNVTFRGLLFPGLMMTADGPRVLEFNCRFGDPETQAILPRLKSDLLPLLERTIDARLESVNVEWDPRPAVTIVMASGGYPEKYDVGKPISGLEPAASEDVQIFHAGTRRQNGEIVTSGGRVLAVTALGETIAAARDRAYEVVSQINFEGCHYRRDIALSAAAR